MLGAWKVEKNETIMPHGGECYLESHFWNITTINRLIFDPPELKKNVLLICHYNVTIITHVSCTFLTVPVKT